MIIIAKGFETMVHAKYAIVIVTYNRKKMLLECVSNATNQTISPDSIIIVNNASTDGTEVYLKSLQKQSGLYQIVDLPQNIGGAGGFAKGIEYALQKNIECILLIDDDAMIALDYMEKILQLRHQYPQYKAFAGTVITDGNIETSHRRNITKIGLLSKNCKKQNYVRPWFLCDIVSFCGMVVDSSLVRQIGLPHAEYFIWYDDTEYSLRVRQYSRFFVVTSAELIHKTNQALKKYPRRYDWKEYYAVRNRLLMVKEHGNLIDRVVNFIHIFIHVIFRNWLFGLIRRDNYDWKYECELVKKALRDAKTLKTGRGNY